MTDPRTKRVACVSDRYTRTREEFDSVDAFVAMTSAVQGEVPALIHRGDHWVDESGERVLEEAPEN